VPEFEVQSVRRGGFGRIWVHRGRDVKDGNDKRDEYPVLGDFSTTFILHFLSSFSLPSWLSFIHISSFVIALRSGFSPFGVEIPTRIGYTSTFLTNNRQEPKL